MSNLIESRDEGLFCPPGNFYIDPARPVDTALITHMHADHARPGSGRYITHIDSVAIGQRRLESDHNIIGLQYGETLRLGDVEISLHPAGHILGSSQIRIEHKGEVWVVSGDYKREADPTCEGFEPVPCDVFMTESTFALPVYRWQDPADVVKDIYHWWQANAQAGKSSVLFCYALGKAQRILAHLAELTAERVNLHGAMTALTDIYRDAGVTMVETSHLDDTVSKGDLAGALTLAPPSASGTPWMRRFGRHASGFCSGWMQIRGNRRSRGYDRGFVLSDHADWPALIRTVEETGAQRVLTMHGGSWLFARYLSECGLDAQSLDERRK